MALSQAIRKAEDDAWFALDPTASTNTNATSHDSRTAQGLPGTCVPQFPKRKTDCRTRRFPRWDYLRAYAKFLDWIETGPDAGWVPKKSCKSLVVGSVVVSACSDGGANPTCVAELVEAMRELDTYCAPDQGGEIWIRRWLKSYLRHHVRDGDNIEHLVVPDEADGEKVPEIDGEEKLPEQE
ncbi:hypothetical protein GGS26DRAFT_554584 [Hypomontagnella submonticulosa]|nr:hypothetical protein GGS26DRAFT_554584 [Hypomontagnella submonticulosa]